MNAARFTLNTASDSGPASSSTHGPVLSLNHVVKRYGSVVGLNDVSVAIGSGITGLIGPNAAGKTTFITMSVGLRQPTGGQVRLLGEDPCRSADARRQAGYCPDGEKLWDHMSGLEFVSLMGEFSGLPQEGAREAANRELIGLGLEEALKRPISTYSRGMRQKVKLAQAIIHRPRFLMLDEPLNGVDPLSRHHIVNRLKELRAEGTAVVVSSHVLHELEGFADGVVFLHKGRLLATGAIDEIRGLLDEHPHTVRLVCDRPRELAKLVLDLAGVVSVDFSHKNTVDIATKSPSEFYKLVPQLVINSRISVSSMCSTDSDLESVFRYLVGGGY